jgi:hypothetical protein
VQFREKTTMLQRTVRLNGVPISNDQVTCRKDLDVPADDERIEHDAVGNATPVGPAASNAALGSRFNQMFPVLSETEIDRVRRFGEVRRFAAGELLFKAGEAVPGMYVILSGRVAVVPRDALGQTVPVAAFAQLIGGTAPGNN